MRDQELRATYEVSWMRLSATEIRGRPETIPQPEKLTGDNCPEVKVVV